MVLQPNDEQENDKQDKEETEKDSSDCKKERQDEGQENSDDDSDCTSSSESEEEKESDEGQDKADKEPEKVDGQYITDESVMAHYLYEQLSAEFDETNAELEHTQEMVEERDIRIAILENENAKQEQAIESLRSENSLLKKRLLEIPHADGSDM